MRRLALFFLGARILVFGVVANGSLANATARRWPLFDRTAGLAEKISHTTRKFPLLR